MDKRLARLEASAPTMSRQCPFLISERTTDAEIAAMEQEAHHKGREPFFIKLVSLRSEVA